LPTTLLSDADQVRSAHDLDGDGFDDLFALSSDLDKLSVLRGGPQGLTLGSVASLTLPKEAYVVLEAADVNGDGVSDAVLLTGEDKITISIRITGRDGDISHAEEHRISLPSAENDGYDSARLAIADVDGDGFDDIVIAIDRPSRHARLIRGGPKALRLDPRRIWKQNDFGPTNVLSIGDYNGDGRDDIVIVGEPFVGGAQFFDFFQGTSASLSSKPSAKYVQFFVCGQGDVDDCIPHKSN
jgi:hypothetical protein